MKNREQNWQQGSQGGNRAPQQQRQFRDFDPGDDYANQGYGGQPTRMRGDADLGYSQRPANQGGYPSEHQGGSQGYQGGNQGGFQGGYQSGSQSGGQSYLSGSQGSYQDENYSGRGQQRGYGQAGYGQNAWGQGSLRREGYGQTGYGFNGSQSSAQDADRGSYDMPAREGSYGNASGRDQEWGFGGGSSRGYGQGGQGGYGQTGFGQSGMSGQSSNSSFGNPYYGQGSSRGGSFGGGSSKGSAPRNYKKSDDRIREDVSERLMQEGYDCSEMDVACQDGIVTLSGDVCNRDVKHRMEHAASDVNGVSDVQNQLKIKSQNRSQITESRSGSASYGGSTGVSGSTSGSSSSSGFGKSSASGSQTDSYSPGNKK
ncbi:MAG: BON domain-containing protein [Phycisphaerales bacterium]